MSDTTRDDELAIRALIERYADAVNRRDDADWAALWTGDGVWEVFGTAIEGRDAVVAAWSGAMQTFSFVFHVVHSAVIDVAGEGARGRWTVSEQLVDAAGKPGILLALYHDEYRREAGVWKIARRRLEPLYQGPPDLSGPLPGAGGGTP
ncbi:MAG: nuclear transport factor 2 family protein [Myxococcota bacterium]